MYDLLNNLRMISFDFVYVGDTCLPKVDNIFDLKESLIICNNHV